MDYEEEFIVRKSDAPVKKELFNNLLEIIQGHVFFLIAGCIGSLGYWQSLAEKKSFRVMFLPSFDMGATRKIRKRLPNISTTKL